eukprot:196603_1
METSTLITLVYFAANLILLLILGYYVKKKGEYESIKSKAFLKDVWAQRSVYTPLILHFYDTATDIGVVYYWYQLMEDEQQNGINYESVDMTVFFWCGISFLLLYRVVTLITVIINLIFDDYLSIDAKWYDVILVLLDIYIFRAVYLSFDTANWNMARNAKIRKSRKEADELEKADQNQELLTETASEKKIAKIKKASKENEHEIEPEEAQHFLQLGEAITESMPQIMLQSAFILLSQNDARLRNNNLLLIFISVIASLFSISTKFLPE